MARRLASPVDLQAEAAVFSRRASCGFYRKGGG
jgi:hypothetical protein